MTCKNKKCNKTEEYNWTVIENKVSPYSLVQNNGTYPVPLWAKAGLVVGVLLLVVFMGVSLL
jgi:hypothetical protein